VIGQALLIAVSLGLGLACAVLAVLVAAARLGRLMAGAAREARLAPHREALLVLAAGGDEDGAATALRTVSKRDWPVVRDQVVALLGKVRGDPADELARLLDERGEFRRARAAVRSRRAITRARAAWLLGLARQPQDVTLLLPLLADRSAGVRGAAARSLGSIGDPVAAAALFEAVQPVGGRPGIPAALAAETLIGFGAGAVPAVAGALAAADATVRAVAAMVAAELALAAMAPQLRSLLSSDPVLEVRVPVVRALGVAGGAEDIAGLAAQTSATQPPVVRRAAVQALGELGHPDAAPVLAGLLPDQDVRLTQNAGDALVEIGPPGLRELLRASEGNDQAARVAAGSLAVAWLRGRVQLPDGVPLPGALTAARGGSPR
jgi:HEAT repeat protein